jgi:hypothetical protein
MKKRKLKTELRDKTRELLKNRPISMTLLLISEATGIEESWLKVFSSQGINEPSVNKVETLYLYLTKSSKIV